MIIIIGLIILIAAVVAGVAVVLGNGGSAHAPIHLTVFGHHVTGTIGTLFLYGIVLGAVGRFGLSLLLAGVRRSYRRSSTARQGLKESRSETAESRRETAAVSKDRDDLLGQRDTARAYTANDLGNGMPGQRSAAGQATATLPESPSLPSPPPMSLPVRPRPRNDSRKAAPTSISRKIAHKAQAVKGAFKKTAWPHRAGAARQRPR